MLYVCVRDGDLSQLGRVQQARDFTCSRSSLDDVIYWLNNASGIYVYRLDNLYSFSEAAWIAAPLTIWLNRSLSSSLGLAASGGWAHLPHSTLLMAFWNLSLLNMDLDTQCRGLSGHRRSRWSHKAAKAVIAYRISKESKPVLIMF
jgi:hypothetical protein